jgi:hypothetical protein
MVTGALGLLGCLSPEPTQPSSGSSVDGGATPRAEVLDVFFGLDNALPVTANFLCLGSGGMDGMPVTFSRRIGIDNPEPSAFQVTTRSGAVRTPRCATLRPALGPSKRHTVLLIGDFGDRRPDALAAVRRRAGDADDRDPGGLRPRLAGLHASRTPQAHPGAGRARGGQRGRRERRGRVHDLGGPFDTEPGADAATEAPAAAPAAADAPAPDEAPLEWLAARAAPTAAQEAPP